MKSEATYKDGKLQGKVTTYGEKQKPQMDAKDKEKAMEKEKMEKEKAEKEKALERDKKVKDRFIEKEKQGKADKKKP